MSAHAVRFHLLVIAVAIAWTGQALADSPTVTAVLSNSEAAIGETVQLQIKISGGRNAEVPDEISVDGLEIHRTGTEQQIEMHNFSMSSSVIYNYTILPLKPGTFRIPSQSIKVAGNSLRTPELTLHVSDTSNGNASRPRSNNSTQQTTDPGRIAFLELVVPKRDAYVGEMIPVEIRLGFAARPVQEPDFGDFNIQGITLHKAEKPEDNVETIKGVKYRVWTVKGAIAAIRPGKLEIPAIEATEVVLLRRSRPTPNPNRNRSPFDVFGSGDPFDDPFFNDPFDSIRGEPTKIPIKSEAVTLDIKPLPPNPPASFSGAVGTFTMNVDVKPKSVQVGDPITVTSTISGRGNFDRMSAPSLEDERGWHKYPPSGKFVQNDDVGISGTKTFEMVISPNEKKSSVPALSFSYFDPLKEKYITLQSDAVPVQVEGSAIVAAQPAATAAGPAAQIGATPKPQDILYQLPDRGPIESFAAIYTRPVFWLAQLVPLAALLGFSGWKIRQGKIGNRETQRLAALQQETAEVERKLRRKDLSPQEYFGAAARAVRLKTALAKNVEPNTVDAELAAKTFDLDGGAKEQLLRLFDRSDELRYSGAGNGADTLSAENRRQVLELIENLRT